MYYLHFIKNFLWISLFYFNAYFLIPLLFYKRKYNRYILALLASVLFIWLADRFMFALLMEGFEYKLRNFLFFNLPVFIFIVLASTAFRTIRDRIIEDSEKQERQNENLKTELSFLRSQISPHFMFNILNNMVALARKKSDILEPSLIKLSSLLRYMLYETDEDKVLLDKEVDYLQSYIDLQRLRFGKNVQINTELQQTAIAYTIEPMLLIPFVENAFKHGVGMIEDAQIDVNLKVEKDQLYFSVRNKFSADSENEPKDKTSGIGLSNVKRRLNLLYHQNHSLMIDKRDGWFTVSLQLKLH
ncbi:MAG: sensor histidine kinase [Lacibacter sp.]